MLLAELMLRVYGMPQLPGLTTTVNGRPCFIDPDLPDFSIAYAGNVIGVLLAEEQSRAGLDMEMVRAHSRQTVEHHLQHLSSGEKHGSMRSRTRWKRLRKSGRCARVSSN